VAMDGLFGQKKGGSVKRVRAGQRGTGSWDCLGLSDGRGGKEGDTVACEVRLRGDMTKGESFYFPTMVGEGGGRKRGAPPPFVMATPQRWRCAGLCLHRRWEHGR
jgi:hypothetical protein